MKELLLTIGLIIILIFLWPLIKFFFFFILILLIVIIILIFLFIRKFKRNYKEVSFEYEKKQKKNLDDAIEVEFRERNGK